MSSLKAGLWVRCRKRIVVRRGASGAMGTFGFPLLLAVSGCGSLLRPFDSLEVMSAKMSDIREDIGQVRDRTSELAVMREEIVLLRSALGAVASDTGALRAVTLKPLVHL